MQELADPMVHQQMADTANICVGQLESRLSKTNNPWLLFELQNVKNLWKAVAKNPIALLNRYRKDQSK